MQTKRLVGIEESINPSMIMDLNFANDDLLVKLEEQLQYPNLYIERLHGGFSVLYNGERPLVSVFNNVITCHKITEEERELAKALIREIEKDLQVTYNLLTEN
ncbi:MAG: hypothetical protein ACRCXZ_10455 [Patescibacteria group bacterium]